VFADWPLSSCGVIWLVGSDESKRNRNSVELSQYKFMFYSIVLQVPAGMAWPDVQRVYGVSGL
jgi:hypothetical protein